jgi:hypothetical protein
MNSSAFFRHGLCVLLVALLAITANGAGKKKKATPPQQQATTITSVTANRVTVSENKTARTFTITQFTEIIVNGQRGTAADLKPGMTVSVTIGTDASRASRINASGAGR